MKTASFRLAAILILQLAVMLCAIQSVSAQLTQEEVAQQIVGAWEPDAASWLDGFAAMRQEIPPQAYYTARVLEASPPIRIPRFDEDSPFKLTEAGDGLYTLVSKDGIERITFKVVDWETLLIYSNFGSGEDEPPIPYRRLFDPDQHAVGRWEFFKGLQSPQSGGSRIRNDDKQENDRTLSIELDGVAHVKLRPLEIRGILREDFQHTPGIGSRAMFTMHLSRAQDRSFATLQITGRNRATFTMRGTTWQFKRVEAPPTPGDVLAGEWVIEPEALKENPVFRRLPPQAQEHELKRVSEQVPLSIPEDAVAEAAERVHHLAGNYYMCHDFNDQPTSILQIIDSDHIIISTSTTGKIYPYRRVQEE